VLGELDRCEGRGATRRCLRWAQVVARDGDTFSPGYLPLAQVAEIDAWLRLAGAELPRVQVRPIALRGERGVVQVIARTVDNTLRQTTVEVGLVAVGDGDAGATVRFPRIEARIERGADASAGASTGAASPSGAAVLPAPGVLVLTVEPATPDQPPRSVRLTLDDSLDRRPASAAPDDERPEGDRDEQPDGDRDEG
jgi:hypothetical protein